MSAVYSTKFLRGKFTSTGSVHYTVPAGYVGVVRTVDVIQYRSGFEQALSGIMLEDSSSNVIWGAVAPFAWSNVPYHLDTHQVFAAGENITLVALDSLWSYAVSGYLLSLP